MYVVETPNQPTKVLLASEVPMAHVYEPDVADELGWGPTFSGNSRATYREIAPQQAVGILDRVGKLTYQSEAAEALLRSLANTAENLSVISPANSPQTLASAIAYLENPEARAAIWGYYVDAAQRQRDSADQQQQA